MQRSEALARFEACPVARLATVRPDGSPHVVPVTFAVAGAQIVTMVDHKPKSTRRLQRITNIEHDARVSLLADSYADDWTRLWWVRIDGLATIHSRDEAWSEARSALAAKYEQYRDQKPEGPAVVVSVDRVISWSSTG